MVEAVRGADTARARWPLQIAVLDTLPVVAELEDDTTGAAPRDSLTVGRALPGGTYFWFFPSGTRVAVTGRRNDDLRLRLSSEVEAWVPVSEARPSGRAVPAPAAVVGSVSVTLRGGPGDRAHSAPPAGAVPGRRGRPVASASSSTARPATSNWMRYGAADSLIRRMRWSQLASDQVALDLDLARPVWGYRARWERNDLLLDIRRPPAIDPGDPLRGRLIAVDPGHPPAAPSVRPVFARPRRISPWRSSFGGCSRMPAPKCS